ncbi:MAG: acyl-CoA dehydrogenase family protein [Acidimicrobiia bacterium]|nr:acyl-CoA dehydrogenase family protein [Acidimicrobiia bacterium]
MNFDLPPELADLADEAAGVARQWSATTPFPEDSWIVGHDEALAKELSARGWIGMTWPTEFGGGGRTPLERFVVFEQLIAGGAPIAAMWFADRQMGPSLLQFGTEEQRRRWLPGILSGETMWSIGMSEPDNGSDVAGLRTRAVPADDGTGDWVVSGQKVWTSGAAVADFIYLIARTDPDAKPHAGLSEFVVDLRTPGIEVRRIVDMTGNDHFCEVHLTDVRVPGENLVGELNGSFRQLMRQMEHERGGIDRLVSNRLLFDDLRRSGWLDTSDPIVRQDLARAETGYRLGRLLVLREVLGQAPPGFSAATKTFGTEFEQWIADLAARAAGPYATLLDPGGDLGSRIARAVSYAPAYTIMGGTTNILRNILGERVLGLPR